MQGFLIFTVNNFNISLTQIHSLIGPLQSVTHLRYMFSHIPLIYIFKNNRLETSQNDVRF
ncbi:hypothetical protein IEQ34_006103 [Dendrobium chrysotoxum]|uniref:Uncharacterized protein n=1 Tax=Dendrobium chrysotoxum TaxID=161865 RepID=A0AAV7HCZ3_DENCH|nr:hypothetical protein IEQ34_006103 [Dendrobium chrysotoxum]